MKSYPKVQIKDKCLWVFDDLRTSIIYQTYTIDMGVHVVFRWLRWEELLH